jgi:4,5-dihydroxyphthalate decarboxylase
MTIPPSRPATLSAMFGTYWNTQALKKGDVKSLLVGFEFPEVKTANLFFKSVVREARFDVSELAIVTFLQAKAYGKPYALLPAVIVSRGQHHTIAYNPERGPLTPRDLAGKRIGVRAYTQTTGAWVRGILADDYGVDLDGVTWVTFEDPHLAEYADPAVVERAPDAKNIVQMLLDGEVDAAVVGDSLPDPRLKYLIPDAEAAGRDWAGRHGGTPINHMAVVRTSLVEARPDIVKDVFRLLVESAKAGKPPNAEQAGAIRFGLDAVRPSLELIIDYSVRQKLIPTRFTVDELFDDTTRALRP